ncbi:MAG: transcription elongation factor GreA [Chloroflexota bacterium]|nr:transcription elongation factor GreA [Chloroflexota bacterium]
MNQRPVYITKEGYAELKDKLQHLIQVRRREVAARLHEALEEGELIENAELEDALREQSFIEGQIQTIEHQLRRAVLIENEVHNNIVIVGCRVTIEEEGTTTPEVYHVVGSAEADPRNGKISNESPLGEALLNKQIGDQAIVAAPDGDIIFNILSIA